MEKPHGLSNFGSNGFMYLPPLRYATQEVNYSEASDIWKLIEIIVSRNRQSRQEAKYWLSDIYLTRISILYAFVVLMIA